jgi:DNA-binding YbaB/EbfC family protein
MNIKQLMKQAKVMQDQLQRDLGQLEVETSVGGGMLSLKMNGHKELLAVTIDREVIDPDDPGILEDLILAGVNDANRRVDEAIREKMGGLGMNLPGLV